MRHTTRRALSYLLMGIMVFSIIFPSNLGAYADSVLPADLPATDSSDSPAIDNPAEEPASEQPSQEQPVSEEPVIEQPVDEQPAAEEPAIEQPAEEQPVSEEPVIEEPVKEQPVVEAPLEDPLEEQSMSLSLMSPNFYAPPEIICIPVGVQSNPSGGNDPSISGFLTTKFDNIGNSDNNDTLNDDGISVTFHDGIKWISWESNFPIAYVFVKGGNDGYLYTYSQWLSEDCGLRAPNNNGGQWPDVSHVTFYYSNKADLQLEKTVAPASAMVGDTVTYSFTVTNNSGVFLKDVQIFDTDIPYTSIKVNLLAGASRTFTKTYVLQAADVVNGEFINEAVAKGYYSYNHKWEEVCDQDDAVVMIIVPQPAVTLEKSVDPKVSKIGDTVTYTFTVTNTGNTALHGVTVSDPMFGEGWPKVYEGTLAAGGVWTFTQTYMIPENAESPLVNTATVTTNEQVCAEDSATITLLGKLIVMKTIGSENGSPQSGISFTLTPIGDGEPVSGSTDENGIVVFEGLEVGMSYHLDEDVPAGYLTNLSDENSFIIDENGVTVHVVNTPVSSLTVIKHIGSMEGPAHEGVTFNLHRVYPDLEVVADVVEPVLSEITDASGNVVFKDLIVGAWYQLDEVIPDGYSSSLNSENNLFQIDADGVVVHVVNTLIPDSLTVIKTIGSEDGPAHSGVTFELYLINDSAPSIMEGPMSEVTDENGVAVFEDLKVGMNYRLVEIVPSGYTTNLDPENNFYIDGQSGAVVHVVNTLNEPSIDIEKSVNSTLVRTGTTVTYTFVVTNTGNTPLYNVVVSDETIGWTTTLESLAAGASQTFTQDYTINSWNSGNQFINTVTVTAYDPQERTVRDEDSATVNRRSSGGGGGGGTTTTTITPEPTPEGTPEVIPQPEPAAPASPEPAPVVIEEAIPLGVPVLPQTGEMSPNLFYGLGSALAALGLLIRRKI